MLLALGLAVLALTACGASETSRPSGRAGNQAGSGAITVFAAASLTDAFNAIAREFQSRHPGGEVVLNFDGSQRLRTQLEHGAVADIFASADREQMYAIEALGLTASPPVNFASNHLVILGYAGPGGNLAPEFFGPGTSPSAFGNRLETLARPGTKIVVGQPAVPIGRYTGQMLENVAAVPGLGKELVDELLANVVSREASVRGIVQKVNLGEADAGVVYSSDARMNPAGNGFLTPPDSVNVTAHYPIAPLTRSEGASMFIDFVLSDQGQRILHNYGFGPPAIIKEDKP